jgi:hypothetical protein
MWVILTWHLSTVTRMNFVVKVDTAEGAKADSNGALPASEVYSMRTANSWTPCRPR